MSVEAILAKVETLPPMPAVAARLLEAAQNPDVDLGVVARWIEQDAAMTANLLRLCNSPFYGLRRQVTSVRQATSLLGMKVVVQIALTILSSRYLSPGQSGYGLAAGELWRSSVGAALAAELVARRVRYPSPSAAYTAGLLQDVGKIVLAEFVAGAMAGIWELIENEGLGFQEAEERTVGMAHPEVGGVLLERWGFPPALVEAVRTHHQPGAAVLDPALARISHLADALTLTLGVGIGADGLAYVLDERALGALGFMDAAALDGLIEELAGKMGEAEGLLALPRGRDPHG